MIRKIEALNYRCLKHIAQPLHRFHVLVGPNASGKTTFLDVIAFMGEIVSDGLESALNSRSKTFFDLLWAREENHPLELAVEVKLPDQICSILNNRYDHVRYEIGLRYDDISQTTILAHEKVWLKTDDEPETETPGLFPQSTISPETIFLTGKTSTTKTIINKIHGGNDNFYKETTKGYNPSFKLGPYKSSLGNLPADESTFPATTWLKGFLTEGIQKIVLNSLIIRKASPPGKGHTFLPDGSNLPWVIDYLQKHHPEKFNNWIDHLRTALPDIVTIKTIERPEDKHRYLMICYQNDLEIPSWMVSDGTLRLLALTLPAYLPPLDGVYLIEEPENGIHPRAIETMYQSLSSVYQAQVLFATHSPVILGLTDLEDVICFAKAEDGAADIVAGNKHPLLRDWKGQTNLSDLFASGVLG